MIPRVEPSDMAFLRWATQRMKLPMPIVRWSSSTAKHPDIWVGLENPGKRPVITVTAEWAKQGKHERRKRLLHELLHLRGARHGIIGKLEYSTHPEQDAFSAYVYSRLMNSRLVNSRLMNSRLMNSRLMNQAAKQRR